MGAKFTPGPWSVPHFATQHRCDCGYVFSDSQHGMGAIATVHRQGGKNGDKHNEPDDVAAANARLIAEAPNMLDALLDLKPVLDRAESNASGNMEWDDVSRRINAARAAIARATGEPA